MHHQCLARVTLIGALFFGATMPVACGLGSPETAKSERDGDTNTGADGAAVAMEAGLRETMGDDEGTVYSDRIGSSPLEGARADALHVSATERASSTPSPMPNATARRTADPRHSPTPFPTPFPTLEVLPKGFHQERLSEPSPDSLWQLRTLAHHEFRRQPSLSDPDQEQLWGYHSQHVVSTKLGITHTVYADWIIDGLGVTWPLFAGWAPDGSAAYVYEGGHPDGCTGLGWGGGLRRIALPSGESRQLLGVPGHPQLSPDGRRIGSLSYGDGGTASLVWIEINSGKLRDLQFDFPPDESGAEGELVELRWAPDVNSAIVRIAYESCSDSWRERLLSVDTDDGTTSTIWEPHHGIVTAKIAGWSIDGSLEIREQASAWGPVDLSAPVQRIDPQTGKRLE